MTHHPPAPKWATRLLKRFVDESDASELVGDLHEVHAERTQKHGRAQADRWYWLQTLWLVAALGSRRVRSTIAPGGLFRDLGHSVRALRRSPGLVVTAVLTLGLGVGGPTTMYGIHSGMFSHLPVEQPYEVVDVAVLDPTTGRQQGVSEALFAEWLRSADSFEHLGAYRSDVAAVSGGSGIPERRSIAWITPSVLELLGVSPILGRSISEEEMYGTGMPTALIDAGLWAERFDSSPDVLGSVLRIDGGMYTIVGVLPDEFGFPSSSEIWPVLRLEQLDGFNVVGRLAEGIGAAAAQDELTALLRAQPGIDSERLTALVDDYVAANLGRDTERYMRILYWMVSSLVVIAGANVAALLLARGAVRQSEVATRMALGGSRARVARQLVMEALLLAAAGSVLGLMLAQFGLDWFGGVLETRGELPYWTRFHVTGPVLLFAAALMGLATLVAGVMPALRTSGIDLSRAMRPGGTRDRARGISRLLPGLVGVEVTLSCALLVLCGVMVKGALATIQPMDAFPKEGVLTARVVMEDYDYPGGSGRPEFLADLRASLSAEASIEAFTIVSVFPGDGTRRVPVRVDGRSFERDQDIPQIQQRLIDEAFFGMFEMDMLQGTAMRPADGEVIGTVVNEAFAREYLGDGPALGRRLVIDTGDATREAEVVGVVSDPGVSVDDGQRVAAFFVHIDTYAPEVLLMAVRSRPGNAGALESIRSIVRSLDPDMPVGQVSTLTQVVAREHQGGRVFSMLFGSFGAAAFLLALVGLHGVVSFSAAQRIPDMGIMRALGAEPARIVGSTLVAGLRPVLVGVVLGTLGAFLLAPMIVQGLFPGTERDPWLFTLVPLALLATSIGAATLPAWRAARIHPVEALRAE